ncbi:MAG: HD domain-containing protein [Opitutaceae bacterium]|nr:HD domain-containing protein [Opitutaceae bacterium]
MKTRLEQQMQFILEADQLKNIFRQSRVIQDRRPENDAEHSWHLSLMILLLSEHVDKEKINILQVLKMIIIHDIVEIDAGDTFAYDTEGQKTQAAREQKAAERLFGLLPSDQAKEFHALFNEFEAKKTPEARFAAAVDRIQPLLLNFNTEGAAWKQHGITISQAMERNRHIEDASVELWNYVKKLLEEAVVKGYLKEDRSL